MEKLPHHIDNHHVFHPKRLYPFAEPLWHTLRNHKAFVIPMDRRIHVDLHKEIVPPPLPNIDVVLGIHNHLHNMRVKDIKFQPQAIDSVASYLMDETDRNIWDRSTNATALRLAANLRQQNMVIRKGYWK